MLSDTVNTLPTIVRRTDIKEMLQSWQSSQVSPCDVQNWAEERFAFGDRWKPEDDLVEDLLERLAHLDRNLIIPEDIPVYFGILEIPAQLLTEAMDELRTHVHSVDVEKRKKKLISDPFYEPWCR